MWEDLASETNFDKLKSDIDAFVNNTKVLEYTFVKQYTHCGGKNLLSAQQYQRSSLFCVVKYSSLPYSTVLVQETVQYILYVVQYNT